MDWKTQKVLVAGSGKSGIGATDLLKKVGAEVIIYDGNDKLKEEDVLNKLENKEDVKVILGELEDSVINEIDMMVLSPGIAIDAPFVLRVKEAAIALGSFSGFDKLTVMSISPYCEGTVHFKSFSTRDFLM